ncbi:MAG: hypothetical protein M3R15_24915 [Acidobacteriota bacterium]|nr:hypothetical protein [Acidobacteriota bacterium]
MNGINLIENGVYIFPDGRHFIARALSDGTPILRGPLFSAVEVVIDYRIDKKGQITYSEDVTPWRVEDLIFKGVLAEY